MDSAGEFQVVGKSSLGEKIRETHNRFRYMDVFESYVNAIDEGYEDLFSFNDSIHKIKTPHFSLFNRCQ